MRLGFCFLWSVAGYWVPGCLGGPSIFGGDLLDLLLSDRSIPVLFFGFYRNQGRGYLACWLTRLERGREDAEKG